MMTVLVSQGHFVQCKHCNWTSLGCWLLVSSKCKHSFISSSPKTYLFNTVYPC